MATITGFTAARMQAIEDECVVSGTVDVNGHLILTQHDTTTIDAGLVRGTVVNMVRHVYTASATWTKPANLKFVNVRVIGSGGGGGGAAGAASSRACAGGGGPGGYSEKLIAEASLGATESVTINDAGTGGAAGNNNGNTGGTVSFGTHLQATGGGGGAGCPSTTTVQNATGGPSGTGSNGDINTTCGCGAMGVVLSAGVGIAGNGGSSFLGAGGYQRSTAGAGNTAGGYGGGGGGAHATTTGYAGGDGKKGIVIVDEYF